MPTYCFFNRKTGERQERFWTISEMESNTGDDFRYIDPDGVAWDRDFAAEQGGFDSNCSNWPMKSDAAGVHPDQIGEARKEAKRFGVPTNFDGKTGQAIFTSRSHRAEYLKAKGYHDRNGGYGDG
tara:strand:- start:1071 stop:1445 length:375 start_codon:yes stop_codon:yes gene_type:complete